MMSALKSFLCILLIFSFSITVNASETCAKITKKSQGIKRTEPHGRTNRTVFDRSDLAREKLSGGLKLIRVSDAFDPNEVFLGLGRPNVFLTLPAEEAGGNHSKFAAKSLWRGPSQFVDTRGFVQSGTFLVMQDLPTGALENLYQQAREHEGTKRITCVNANCRLLADAGFSIPETNLRSVKFPNQLAKLVLDKGLFFGNEKVEVELVRTTPDNIERHEMAIDKAEKMTLVRHAKRHWRKLKASSPVVAWIVRAKNKTKSVVAVWIHGNKQKPEVLPYEEVQTVLNPTGTLMTDLEVYMSVPSQVGVQLRRFWGQHSLFEIKQNRVSVSDYLPKTLKPFPQQEKFSLVTWLKKKIAFSKPVVGIIRSQLSKNYTAEGLFDEKTLYDMIRTSTEKVPHKYNIVITDARIIISKLNTGLNAADWVLTKHVLMANYSTEVHFAGEAWKTSDGKLHINNNSGTFIPDNDKLAAAVEYLSEVFPNVEFQGEPF